jgi:hypothetical protein
MPGFYDKRREFREGVDSGAARIGGRVFPVVNWSRGGILVGAWTEPVELGQPFKADVRVMSGGRVYEFSAGLEAVRLEADRRRLAFRFAEMDIKVRAMVDRHFDPGLAMLDRSAGAVYGEQAAADDPGLSPPEPDQPSMPAGFEEVLAQVARTGAAVPPAPLPQEGLTSAEALAGANACLKLLRVAVARRLHPDVAPDDGSRELRAQVLVDIWGVIDDMERDAKQRLEALRSGASRPR